jgi:hypothetical protein
MAVQHPMRRTIHDKRWRFAWHVGSDDYGSMGTPWGLRLCLAPANLHLHPSRKEPKNRTKSAATTQGGGSRTTESDLALNAIDTRYGLKQSPNLQQAL